MHQMYQGYRLGRARLGICIQACIDLHEITIKRYVNINLPP